MASAFDAAPAYTQPSPAAMVDSLPGKPRVLVLSDIGNEPDDQMSLTRFLVYANEFDIEGLVATTSTWQRETVRPDIMMQVIEAYGPVQPMLSQHADGFPTAAALKALVASGQPAYGMAAVGEGKLSPGAELLIHAADRDDPRPLWVTVWGGANTLAQALWQVRATRSPEELDAFVSKLRVYSISDQDDAGPWIRQEFPDLFYIAHPSSPDGSEYYAATWTGIAGDRFYENAPGADFTTVTNEWLDEHIRSKGSLGKAYPRYLFIMEGDTPSFLNLITNGLASHRHPGWGGWGGRYVYRTPSGETRPFWTQGGDAFPGAPKSRDRVVGSDGQPYTSDQATIWRWREAFQHDFAARMDWTVSDVADANHNPIVVVNGQEEKEPIRIDAEVDTPVVLDAAGTHDPDGDALTYTWFVYPEAQTGNAFRMTAQIEGEEGAQKIVPLGPRATITEVHTPQTTVLPNIPGETHIILAVEDDGEPSLTSYRRIILNVHPASDQQ
ncbi:MAG TPA: nucleoside hydrolase-like domain-containing protein [Rhodothermales bacterium]|nr:nucleoside hydrolase-like domain-containing protein [Rhodothermales bacterium]